MEHHGWLVPDADDCGWSGGELDLARCGGWFGPQVVSTRRTVGYLEALAREAMGSASSTVPIGRPTATGHQAASRTTCLALLLTLRGTSGLARGGRVRRVYMGSTRSTITATVDGLASNNISALAVRGDGHLWFATDVGVSELDEQGWKTYSREGLDATAIAAGSEYVWLATSSGALRLTIATKSTSCLPQTTIWCRTTSSPWLSAWMGGLGLGRTKGSAHWLMMSGKITPRPSNTRILTSYITYCSPRELSGWVTKQRGFAQRGYFESTTQTYEQVWLSGGYGGGPVTLYNPFVPPLPCPPRLAKDCGKNDLWCRRGVLRDFLAYASGFGLSGPNRPALVIHFGSPDAIPVGAASQGSSGNPQPV